MMLEMGKQTGRKDDVKLLQCVNEMKQKYISLRQAYHLADILWTKFHRQTYVKSKSATHKKKKYVNYPPKILTPLRIITSLILFHFSSPIKNTREKGLCDTV